MKIQNIAAWCFIIFIFIYALIIGKALLRPLAIAIVITFLINTLSRFVQRIPIGQSRIPRGLSNAISLLIILGFLILCIEIIIGTVNRMAVSAHEYQQHLETMGDTMLDQFGLDDVPRVGTMLSQINLRPLVTNLGAGLSGFAGRFLLILVYVVFLLLEQELFRRKFHSFFDTEEDYLRANSVLNRIAESVRTYLSVKAFTSLLTAILIYVALSFIGLKFAVFWAFIVFLFNFIPNIGSWIATAMPVLFAMVQFDDVSMVFYTLGAVAFIQLLVGNYIDPRMMGRSLNISPLVVLFSLFFWGAIWGVMGMVLSIPIMVSLLIIFSQFPQTQKIAMLLSQSGKIAGQDLSEFPTHREAKEDR